VGVNAFRAGGPPHRLMLTFPRWLDEPTRVRATTTLRLLAPAFEAGVEAVRRLTAAPGELARVLDLLAGPTLVFDRRGAALHRKPAFAVLAGEVRAGGGPGAVAALDEMLRALAAGVGALLGPRRGVRGTGALPPEAVREFTAGTHRLRARACFTAEDSLAPDALVWVTVERVEAATRADAPIGDARGDETLRARYALTAQECQVARLMAERRTDAEIGTALGISPHTARTHAERVRRKLGGVRRTEVAAALAAPTPPAHGA
jgi:DNA-binding CsgD family transcriptional regulator